MGEPDPSEHERAVAAAFDGQAAQFERAPVQSDPEALARLVRAADLPPDSLVLDAGCGPGLVAEAFLRAGQRVHGVDLSPEMVERARRRCAEFGEREMPKLIDGSALLCSEPDPDTCHRSVAAEYLARPAARELLGDAP